MIKIAKLIDELSEDLFETTVDFVGETTDILEDIKTKEEIQKKILTNKNKIMSITISIKSQNVDRDVVIPVEWKDITVKYWGELSSIIKKHYDDASENEQRDKAVKLTNC